jgi:GT2 family glycosyltransferase
MKNRISVSVITPVFKSSKWLMGYFKSLNDISREHFALEVVIVDNDPRSLSLEQYYAMSGELDLKILTNDENVGFGSACNQGAEKASGDILLFLNVDTSIEPDALRLMVERLEREPGCAMVEARQIPEEHPKFYWPDTGRVEWCSACCLLMRRNLFLEVGGFDKNFFLYCEDVDLSFRLTNRGYKLAYLPEAVCNHFSSDESRHRDNFRLFHEIKSSVILRARYMRTWDFLSSLYQQLLRIICGRTKGSTYKSISAMKEGLKVTAAILMERWSNRNSIEYKQFGDRGEFSLHYRFPPEVLSESEATEVVAGDDFSVIIPTVNRGFLIDNLCESILVQLEDLGVGELIIVDYGSSVGSVEGLRERFKSRGRLKVLKAPATRWAAAIGKGIQDSKGELLIFLADTIVPNPKLIKSHLKSQLEHDIVSGKVVDSLPVSGSPFRKYIRDRLIAGRHLLSLTSFSGSYLDPTMFRNCSFKRSLITETEDCLSDYALNFWSGRAAIEKLLDRIFANGHKVYKQKEYESLDTYVPTFRTFMARAFKYGFTLGNRKSDSPNLASVFIRQLLSFIFVVTPLSLPGLIFEIFLPCSQKINPLAAWWFSSFERLFFSAGELWYCRFRDYFV